MVAVSYNPPAGSYTRVVLQLRSIWVFIYFYRFDRRLINCIAEFRKVIAKHKNETFEPLLRVVFKLKFIRYEFINDIFVTGEQADDTEVTVQSASCHKRKF